MVTLHSLLFTHTFELEFQLELPAFFKDLPRSKDIPLRVLINILRGYLPFDVFRELSPHVEHQEVFSLLIEPIVVQILAGH